MAAKDFKLISYNKDLGTLTLATDWATAIEAGDMVALSSGLAIKAVDTSMSVAYTPTGCASTDTTVQVIADPDAIFSGTSDANFAVTDRGIFCDMVTGSGTQKIDVGTSLTRVFRILPDQKAGTASSTSDVRFKINRHLSNVSEPYAVVTAWTHTTAWGAATESITTTWVVATDIVVATLETEGSTPVTLDAAATNADAVDLTFSADPSTDHIVSYVVYRAVS